MKLLMAAFSFWWTRRWARRPPLSLEDRISSVHPLCVSRLYWLDKKYCSLLKTHPGRIRLSESVRRRCWAWTAAITHIFALSLRGHEVSGMALNSWRDICPTLGRDESTCHQTWKYTGEMFYFVCVFLSDCCCFRFQCVAATWTGAGCCVTHTLVTHQHGAWKMYEHIRDNLSSVWYKGRTSLFANVENEQLVYGLSI